MTRFREGIKIQMEKKTSAKKYIPPRPKETSCESCMYFDYDQQTDTDICTLDLDEDEMVDFMTGRSSACPYYRYYNEYKSVQKQN